MKPLPPYDEDLDAYNVVIETPKGSRNKLAWDEERDCYRMKAVLPEGHSFPYDFGFLPSTLGGDGDPLDVLVLMDAPTYPGVLVPTRLIGVIVAEQTEKDGKVERNDRLIGVATGSRIHQDIRELADLNKFHVDEMEHFFISYNNARGKEFKPLRRQGADKARALVKKGEKAWLKQR
jgi:inorganic pyrophosphatase